MSQPKAITLLVIEIGKAAICLIVAFVLLPLAFACWFAQEILRQPKFSVDNKGELHSKGFELNS